MLCPWRIAGKAGAEQVSPILASLLAALATPQILYSFLYEASIKDPGLLLEANDRGIHWGRRNCRVS